MGISILLVSKTIVVTKKVPTYQIKSMNEYICLSVWCRYYKYVHEIPEVHFLCYWMPGTSVTTWGD